MLIYFKFMILVEDNYGDYVREWFQNIVRPV